MYKLKQLARACQFEDAEMATRLIYASLDSYRFVHSIQREYTKEGRLWVTVEPLEEGKTKYKVSGEQDFIRKGKNILKDSFLNFRRDKRITISISNEYDEKLGMLSDSLDCKKAALAALIVHFSLDSGPIIDHFQNKYCVKEYLRVAPLTEDGIVTYFYLAANV